MMKYKKYDSEDIKGGSILNRMDLAYRAADVIISRLEQGNGI